MHILYVKKINDLKRSPTEDLFPPTTTPRRSGHWLVSSLLAASLVRCLPALDIAMHAHSTPSTCPDAARDLNTRHRLYANSTTATTHIPQKNNRGAQIATPPTRIYRRDLSGPSTEEKRWKVASLSLLHYSPQHRRRTPLSWPRTKKCGCCRHPPLKRSP